MVKLGSGNLLIAFVAFDLLVVCTGSYAELYPVLVGTVRLTTLAIFCLLAVTVVRDLLTSGRHFWKEFKRSRIVALLLALALLLSMAIPKIDEGSFKDLTQVEGIVTSVQRNRSDEYWVTIDVNGEPFKRLFTRSFLEANGVLTGSQVVCSIHPRTGLLYSMTVNERVVVSPEQVRETLNQRLTMLPFIFAAGLICYLRFVPLLTKSNEPADGE